ncbi:MAG: hypothetical protein ACWA6U_18400 [Breznakibacter sp.]
MKILCSFQNSSANCTTGGRNVINRGWNPRIKEPYGKSTPKRVELEYSHQWLEAMVKATWLNVLKPDGFLLSLFGLCLFSLALMIRFAPLQLQRVNRALGSAAWRSQKISSNRRSQESRRCACSPKNYHSAALEAIKSVRKTPIMTIPAY